VRGRSRRPDGAAGPVRRADRVGSLVACRYAPPEWVASSGPATRPHAALDQAEIALRHDGRQRVEPRPPRARPGRRRGDDGTDVALPGRGDLAEQGAAGGRADKAATRPVRRQRGSGIRADDGLAVRPVVDPERQAQAAVGEQGVPHDAGRSLRAEDEVDAQGSAACRDVDEQRVQLGECAEHRGEFIDDDHEPRECAGRPDLAEVPRARIAEGSLPVAHLRGQASERACGLP
jgi:hypothetical protein